MEIKEIKILQQKIFQYIALRVGSPQVVPVLCNLLHLSKSAVYDRVNGKKEISFSELIQILDAFKLSLEDIIGNRPERVNFLTNSIQSPIKNGETYMKKL